jgi:hypothetical protein
LLGIDGDSVFPQEKKELVTGGALAMMSRLVPDVPPDPLAAGCA